MPRRRRGPRFHTSMRRATSPVDTASTAACLVIQLESSGAVPFWSGSTISMHVGRLKAKSSEASTLRLPPTLLASL